MKAKKKYFRSEGRFCILHKEDWPNFWPMLQLGSSKHSKWHCKKRHYHKSILALICKSHALPNFKNSCCYSDVCCSIYEYVYSASHLLTSFSLKDFVHSGYCDPPFFNTVIEFYWKYWNNLFLYLKFWPQPHIYKIMS